MPLTEQIELAKPLEKAGFTERQAEILATWASIMHTNFTSFKNEINTRFDALETEMRTRFDAVDQRLGGVDQRLGSLETEMRTRLGALESELRSLPWKILAIMLTTAGLVVASLKWL